MRYEQLLHDFVDGTLDYQSEALLFTELQTNESLRADLKMMILMQEAVSHDISAFTPAADSSEVIFRRLGFATGMEDTAPRSVRGVGFLRRYMQGLVGGIVGAIIMAFFFTGSDNPLPQISSSRATASEEPSSVTNSSGSSAARALYSASDGDMPRSRAASGRVEIARDAAVTSSDNGDVMRREHNDEPMMHNDETMMENDDRSTISSSLPPEDVAITHVESRRSLPSESVDEIEPAELDRNVYADISPLYDLKTVDILPLSVEYRALASRGFTPYPETLENGSEALLRDKALALHYQLGDGRGVGIEIGQEEFYQRFEERIPNGGDIILHEQNPVLLWGGISLRQVFRESSELRPYLQLTAGGTRVGPVGRMLLGATFDVAPMLQIIGGGEISTLAYSFDGRWYLSPKYALTYGAALRF